MEEKEISTWTPKDYVAHIDEKFYAAKRKKMSRFDVEWGQWSRQMNLALRLRTVPGDPDCLVFKHVFMYWTVLSRLLELNLKKMWNLGKIAQENRTAAELRSAILSGKKLKDFDISSPETVKNILK
jgi:hypothetical protein